MKAEHISITSALEQMPNIDQHTARLLIEAGIQSPLELKGQDAWCLYDKICQITRQSHDYRLLDIILSAVDFAAGNSPRHWSDYSAGRKKLVAAKTPARRC